MWVIDNDTFRLEPFSAQPTGYFAQVTMGQGVSSLLTTIDYRSGYGIDGGFVYDLESADPTPTLTGSLFRLETGLNFEVVTLVGHDGFCFSRINDPAFMYPERFWVYENNIYILATDNHPISPGDTVIAKCVLSEQTPQVVDNTVVLRLGYTDFNCSSVDVAGLEFFPAASTPQAGEFTQSAGEITLHVSPTQAPAFNSVALLTGYISTEIAPAYAAVKVFELHLQSITYIDNILYRALSYVPAIDAWSPQLYELVHNEAQNRLFLFCPA